MTLYDNLSDHCQVSTMLKVNCIFNAVQKDVYSIPNQYIWEENSAEKFQNALASPLVQEKIKTFNNTNYTGDSNIMIQDLNNILYEAANISIKKKIIKKVNSTAKVKKSQQSKWFDLPLINMKKQLCDKEKLFKKYNKDPYIRSSFFALLKKYRKARKTKYREFRADLIDQLDNLREENPKSYWTLLESLKNSDKKTEKSSNITSTEWAEYFKDLNKKPVTPSPNIIEFLRNLENAKVFTELDILITDKEISDAIHTLKNKKSCGPDSISNEMIKNSQSFLIKSLNHVFNKILSTGNYPQIWANGFITALFKNGSKDDPSNYRGLTVTSCLSKIQIRDSSSCKLKKYQSDDVPAWAVAVKKGIELKAEMNILKGSHQAELNRFGSYIARLEKRLKVKEDEVQSAERKLRKGEEGSRKQLQEKDDLIYRLNPILSAFSVFDPAMMPEKTNPLFKRYGDDKLQTLANHFYDDEESRDEEEIQRDKQEGTPTEYTLQRIIQLKSQQGYIFPKLAKIAAVILSLPISNALPERGASAVKRTPRNVVTTSDAGTQADIVIEEMEDDVSQV
ncbi:unnamed protein product [Mytilus edulis]|uniref:Uncharacterized protein n=1 Tax=Mytilus edulis TaxID=6550 RepID=A0A8S3VLS0_MYTED|nr:unnamed protein product [Mytilus edulis]